MNVHRFDTLTRSLTTRFSRRQAVGAAGLGIVAAGATGLGLASSQERPAEASPTPVSPVGPVDPAMGEVSRTYFLFVQTFNAGTMTEHPDDPSRYILTLTGHAAETVYFSDRPERIVGSLPTPQFLEGLGFPDDNPPNAALVAGEHVVVVELFNPVYEETFGAEGTVTLTYEVAILADYNEEGLAHLALQKDKTPPENFESASLFIDDCPDHDIYCEVGVEKALLWRNGPLCYDWLTGRCVPCQRDELARQCNERFPAMCKGRCKAETLCRACWA